MPDDDLVDAVGRLLELASEDEVLGENRDRDEAILFNIIILGEATKRLKPETRRHFPSIPWQDMAETRDRIVHHYEGVKWDIVEGILKEDLPKLLPSLITVCAKLREKDGSPPSHPPA